MTSLSLLHLIRCLGQAGLALIAFAGGSARLSAQPPAGVQLPNGAKGTAAISALGEHLPDVAKAYGLDPQELATLLQLQPSLGVDVSGALVFVCGGSAVDPLTGSTLEPSGGMTATSSLTKIASGSTVDAFQLHSLPGASRVIYLDFDGHTTSGTIWNSSYAGGSSIVSTPFDQDGDPSTFSESERATIQGIWRRVAEDYAPFAVNVTTQDPGIDALRRTSSSDTTFGVRAVISPTNSIFAGYGGVAYVGSFNWDSDTPSFTFTLNLANAEKYIAENISHEVGHTLGLNHDGVSGSSPSEYYYGHGDWAPIMGTGFYKSITQFSKGEYANATNLQDDVAVIANYAPLVADDHGNTTSGATVLSGPNVANGGTIETRTDVDVFRFDSGDGVISLNIVSPAGEPDLHVKAELLNANNQVLSSTDTITGNISFNFELTAGTYYLRLTGVGYGDPKTSGYSNYGSLGNYVITGTLVAISGKQAPTARASALTTSGMAALTVDFTGQNSSDPDGTIVSYSWNFGNGSTSSATNPSYTYNSAGTYIAVLTVVDNDGLASSASVAITVTAPTNLPPVAKASANVTSGTAPLPITFSSAGSSDADGSIASYKWNFGDGTSSTAASPSKTYSAAGKYSVVLTVTDNSGASASASVSVTVTTDANAAAGVRQYSLSNSTANAGTSAIGLVIVRDALDRPVVGAAVTIQWSGLVSNKTTSKTDANGQVLLGSGRTKKNGTITGTITTVVPPAGLVYDGSLYTTPTVASTTVN